MTTLVVPGTVALLLLVAGCTKGGDDTGETDTEDTQPVEDTGLELWGLQGSATVFPGASYNGTSTMYDEVVVNTGGRYQVGERVCEIEYPAQTGVPPTPAISCPGCTFAFNIDHGTAADIRQGPDGFCDDTYGGMPPLTDTAFWDLALGWDDTNSQLLYYAPAYGSDPAGWEVLGGATGALAGADFAFDWPIRMYQY